MKDMIQRVLVPFSLSPEQLAAFALYGQRLLEKNQVMNLTAITQPEAVAQLHFADSLALTKVVDLTGKTVIDVGCGAGFPGVPLKIGVPSISLTLLDSTAKRMDWLSKELLPELGLDALCLTGRAEELAADRREQYDVAVSRAVARLNILCELCLPFVKVGGRFLAMKGAAVREELEEAKNALRLLGGELKALEAYPIGDAAHYAVVIEKVRPTPARYPRRYTKIKQQPL